MKTEEGTVIEISGDDAMVRAGRHAECRDCGACPGSDAPIVRVRNTAGAQVGQRILFEVRDENTLKGAFLIFVLPLIALFGGILLGGSAAAHLAVNGMLGKTAGGILFLALAVVFIRMFDAHVGANAKTIPAVVKILR